MWEGTSADHNGTSPETSNSEPTTPSPVDPGNPAAAVGAATGDDLSAAGVMTTCHVCTDPRVSRRTTCQGCHNLFHWTCMGFYEHKYQKPGPSWRCKECKALEPTPPDAPGKGEAGASPAVQPVQPAEPESEPGPGRTTDVGEQAPASMTPEETVPPGVRVPPVEVGTVAEVAGIAAAPPAGASAPAVTVQSPTLEQVCPFCMKGLGRKRTLDCTVCHKPWHAMCVNVRGAETPKSWVCRDCKSDAQATAGTSPRNAAAESAASPSVALETVSGRF